MIQGWMLQIDTQTRRHTDTPSDRHPLTVKKNDRQSENRKTDRPTDNFVPVQN